MKTLMLSDSEAKILAHLLKRAAEEFSRHGCNDFDIQGELGLPKAEAEEIAHALRVRLAKTNVAEDDYPQGAKGTVLMDWMLFHLFERMVKQADERAT